MGKEPYFVNLKINFGSCVEFGSCLDLFQVSGHQTLATPVFRLRIARINFNSTNAFAVLSDLTGKDDVFLDLHWPLFLILTLPLLSFNR